LGRLSHPVSGGDIHILPLRGVSWVTLCGVFPCVKCFVVDGRIVGDMCVFCRVQCGVCPGVLRGRCSCEWGFGEVFGRVWRGFPGWVPQCSLLGVLGRGMIYVFFGGVGNRCGVLEGFGDEGDVYLESFLCPL
jgi:hypothetical protein